MTAQRKIHRRALDGVLLLDKPSGMTSNAALQCAKRLLNAAKAGHTGTLDPMATGLLPLTFGEATKFSQVLLDADKSYDATLRLGVETDTGDAEGTAVTEAPVAVDLPDIERALVRFTGLIEQVPPMYSALKRDGKPLYEYARAGVEVERAPRQVRIHTLGLVEAVGDMIRLHVDCSKGTYIRTLATDVGRALGCGAHLVALRRTRIGPFDVGQAVALAALEAAGIDERTGFLEASDLLVLHLPQMNLDGEQARAIRQGRVLDVGGDNVGPVRLYDSDRFLGLGELQPDGKLSPKRLIASSACNETLR